MLLRSSRQNYSQRHMSDDLASPPRPAADAKRPGKKNASQSRRVFGRRIKFIWGSSRIIRGHWHLGVYSWYDRVAGKPWSGLAISVRGLLLWGLGCSVGLYLSGTAAIYAVRSRNPYNLISYSDVLLWPGQRARMTELTGRAFIAEGLADLKEQRYAEGVSKLHLGLARCPEETQARLVLAQIYIRANQRPRALKTLLERLNAGYPGRAFLEVLFSFAAGGEDYAVILDACNRYRAGRDAQAAVGDRPWLLQRQVQALLAARRAGEALQLTEAAGANAPAAITEARILALVDLGRYDEATGFLTAWRAKAGANLAQVLRLQVRVFRETRRFAEMEATLQELSSLAPADPNPAAFRVVQRAMAGQDELASTALDDYFFRFDGSRENLLLVAQPLAEIAALPLVQRCFDRAVSLGYDAKPFRMSFFLTQMQRGAWTAAQQTLEQLRPQILVNDPAETFWLKWQERLIAAAIDPAPSAQEPLLEILQARPLPLPVYYQTGTMLLRANRPATARRVHDVGQRYFPASSSLAQLRTDVERARGAQQAP